MNIVLDIKNIDPPLLIDNIQYLDTKKNIIMEGNFTKIIYSDENITINGLYIYFPFTIKSIYNYKAYFDSNENRESINKILEIEKNLLQHYREIYGKKGLVFSSILAQFNTGFIKLNSFNTTDFVNENIFKIQYNCVLKISGVWEKNETIGMNYKFLQTASLISDK
jgi:hypothetical protein